MLILLVLIVIYYQKMKKKRSDMAESSISINKDYFNYIINLIPLKKIRIILINSKILKAAKEICKTTEFSKKEEVTRISTIIILLNIFKIKNKTGKTKPTLRKIQLTAAWRIFIILYLNTSQLYCPI